jgi:hypothetical protein
VQVFGAFVAHVKENDSSALFEERVIKHVRARAACLEHAQEIMAELTPKLNELHAKVVNAKSSARLNSNIRLINGLQAAPIVTFFLNEDSNGLQARGSVPKLLQWYREAVPRDAKVLLFVQRPYIPYGQATIFCRVHQTFVRANQARMKITISLFDRLPRTKCRA